MPLYSHTALTHKQSSAHEQVSTGGTFPTSIMADAAHKKPSSMDIPVDYRSQMQLFATRSDRGQQVRKSHQQQQHQRQQQYQQAQTRSLPHTHSTTVAPVPPMQPKKTVASAVTTILPYCTADVPLSEEQVIAVTDVAGSLKELVLLALGAKSGDEECLSRLEGARSNEQAMASVVDFFSDEFEI